jgi:hypothetical protein
MDIILVRQRSEPVTQADADACRRVLFGIVDGLGEINKRRWRRFVGGLAKLEAGEIVEVKTLKPRSGPFHRRHMKIEQTIFEAQERFESFEAFRAWLKVGSGFVDWYPGPKGGVIPVPKSIAFDQLENDAMRELHLDMVIFLRTEHAGATLWKHLSPVARIEMIERLLAQFDE